MKVAFQGVSGAYSEEAARQHFGASCEAVGCAFSEQVFESVEKQKAQYGILPVENSIAGNVGMNADLLLKRDVFIVGETYLKIEHALLGLPGTAIKDVKSVYSHPVALAQCQDFIRQHHLRAIPEYDTAGSAELVADRRLPGEAAIASKRCAEIYGLSVLSENIQSSKNNITRFVVFAGNRNVPVGLKMEKTSLAFTAKHHPGALLNCLKRFADQGINLTRLESRPIPENPFEYSFFVDFVGGINDEPVKRAIKELGKDASVIKVLGSYPAEAKPPSGR